MPRKHAGAPVLTIRISHAWYWRPRPYRHISGGLACHWLGWHVLLHDVEADRKNDEAMSAHILERWARERTRENDWVPLHERYPQHFPSKPDTPPGAVDKDA